MGAVDTTYTFSATDTITSTKMNNIIDQTTITGDAILGTTLEVASGKLKVRAQNITSNELATDAVTNTKIFNSSVTTDKIADLNVTTIKLADANVTTIKLADANITPAKLSQPLTSRTVQNSTSGTSIDFASIPSWVRRITVMFQGVSTSSASNIQIQLGSGTIQTTGYLSSGARLNVGGTGASSSTTGLLINSGIASGDLHHGNAYITNISGNSWVMNSILGSSTSQIIMGGGSVSLSGVLDRLRITTISGTDAFDSGSINIMYE